MAVTHLNPCKVCFFTMPFDFQDDHSLSPPPLDSADIDAGWADRRMPPERGVIHESQENLRWLADLVRGMRKEILVDANGRAWEVLARKVGNTDSDLGDPWTPRELTAGRIAIRTGLINGTIIPANANLEFVVPATLTHYWLELSFSGHLLTGAAFDSGAAVPANPAPNGTFPARVYYRLFQLKRNSAGGIDQASYVQYARRNFSVASYVANITGRAPEYTVHYGIAFLE